ncbi:MAG: pilus assembly protein [Comamonadaceae bacterium]|nr:MAG: pilus assembly protein [Comamonadaceae bacterium]
MSSALRVRRRRLAGVASLEFALVLPIFVLLIYGLIVYALVFAAQHTLVNAAAEGARAALRHGTIAQRELAACQVARDASGWITSVVGAAPECVVSADCTNAPCRRVRMTYDYLARPLVPSPPLFAALVPERLQSSAVVHFIP